MGLPECERDVLELHVPTNCEIATGVLTLSQCPDMGLGDVPHIDYVDLHW